MADLKTVDSFDANFLQIQEIENKLNLLEEKINVDKVVNYLKTDVLIVKKLPRIF
jgi:hypothetical protein